MYEMPDNSGDFSVIVEFPPPQGGQGPVGKQPVEDQIARSHQAIEKAMQTIQYMADRVQATIGTISEPPHSMEVEFGITFSAEAGALLARAGTECSISVKLAWSRDNKG
jgi:hypothetical protein